MRIILWILVWAPIMRFATSRFDRAPKVGTPWKIYCFFKVLYFEPSALRLKSKFNACMVIYLIWMGRIATNTK